jgi:hypothetical protein
MQLIVKNKHFVEIFNINGISCAIRHLKTNLKNLFKKHFLEKKVTSLYRSLERYSQ